MNPGIRGKVALVTGASGGIGQAIAESLAREGAKVAIMARRKEKLEEVYERITKDGGSCLPVEGDVTDRKQVEDVVKKVETHWGPVEVLVNNAAVLNPTPMENLRVEDWLQVVDVNVKGVLHCIGATLGSMVERGSGHVINISSVGGKQAFSNLSPETLYSGSKYFIQGFTSGMRQELASKGIKASTICPGGVSTEIFSKFKDPDAAPMLQSLIGVDLQKQVEEESLLLPEDIAEAVCYILNQPSRVGIDDVVIQPRGMALI